MAYGMKYTKGGFPFKSSPVKDNGDVDLTRKPTIPMENYKPPKKSTTTAHGQLNDAEIEAKEDAAGVTTNIKMPKVHQSGNRNRVHTKDGVIETNWVNPHAVKP